MQAVSPTFSGYTNDSYRPLTNGVLISWDKQTASGIQYFTIGTSVIGGNDILKSTGGGTIAVANQYKYTTIPASGIVGWQTSMSLNQYPYGIVQRQADITLANASTGYLAASGTSLGQYIDSGRPIIVQAGFGNETIPMFTGYSDSPVNDINARTTSLHCYDAIDYLNSYNSSATLPIQNKKADQVIAILLAEAGFSSSQYILESSLNSPIAYLDPFGLMIGDIIRDLCEAEAAIFFADESGIMHFWNRQHFSNNSTPVATLSYSNIQTLSQQNSPIINYVKAESIPLALVSGYQNVYSLNQPYYIQANGVSGTNLIINPSIETAATYWVGNYTRQNASAFAGDYSASGTYIAYGAPQPGGSIYTTASGVPYYDTVAGGNVFHVTNISFYANIPRDVPVNASIIRINSFPGALSPAWVAISGTGNWTVYTASDQILSGGSADNAWSGTSFLAVSGTTSNGFLVDAISNDSNSPYYDGNTVDTSLAHYSWSGTANFSPSYKTQKLQYLTIQIALSSETYSLVAPVASGLNNPSIGAKQSFYSFSSASGIGGIYGQDLTPNISLVSYSVSGTTAFLTFQNNSTNQAYLTNLELYGQVATTQTQISQYYLDQTSINKYRLNPANNGQIMSISNNYIPRTGDALGLCEYLVQNYSTPFLRSTINNFSQPQLQFGDCVNLYNRDTDETRLGYIFGVQNGMDNQGNLTQSLMVQERNIANYFTIGASVIGGTSQIAP